MVSLVIPMDPFPDLLDFLDFLDLPVVPVVPVPPRLIHLPLVYNLPQALVVKAAPPGPSLGSRQDSRQLPTATQIIVIQMSLLTVVKETNE